MNELMTALEAMITRIVRTEFEFQAATRMITTDNTDDLFAQQMTTYLTQGEITGQFMGAVKRSALDHDWFDNAIKEEANTAIDNYDFVEVLADKRDARYDSDQFRTAVQSVVEDMDFSVSVS